MAIKKLKVFPTTGKLELDLNGPDGDAHKLMAYAVKANNKFKLGLDMDRIIYDEMIEGDYNNIISLMEKYFGDYIIMYHGHK